MEHIDLSGMGLPEKEQKILEAAIQVFGEKGFSAATTSEIAKSAGIAEGTIFRYFKTKKDILHSILIHTLQLLSGSIILSPIEKILSNPAEKDLRTILTELIRDRLLLAKRMYPMARVVLSEALYHKEIRNALMENMYVKAQKIFIDFHKQMVQCGLMRGDIEPTLLFVAMLGSVAAFVARQQLFSQTASMEDTESQLNNLVDIILHGVSPAIKAQE